MDPAAISAVVISVASLATAGIGWFVQRKQGLPSSFALTIRGELEEANKILEKKATRLEQELADEKRARAGDHDECADRINGLADGIVERDLVISALHRRLGMPPPHLTDPRG